MTLSRRKMSDCRSETTHARNDFGRRGGAVGEKTGKTVERQGKSDRRRDAGKDGER